MYTRAARALLPDSTFDYLQNKVIPYYRAPCTRKRKRLQTQFLCKLSQLNRYTDFYKFI